MLLLSIVRIGVNPETSAYANVELQFFHTHTRCTCWKSHRTASLPAHDTARLKIRIRIQIKPLPCSAQWQFTLLFSGSARIFSVPKWILPASAKSVSEGWGQIEHSSGPTTMDVFPLTDTENNSNKLNGSNKVCMHPDQSQTSGKILICAVKSCSAFWANSSPIRVSCSFADQYLICRGCCVLSLAQTMVKCTQAGILLRKDRQTHFSEWKKSRMSANQTAGSAHVPSSSLADVERMGSCFSRVTQTWQKMVALSFFQWITCPIMCYWLIAH